MAEKNKLEEVSHKLASDLLERMGVSAQVTVVKEGSDTVKINIEGDDLGILIGFHGENLKALQIILGILINREIKSEEWARVLVDVGSWRTSRESSLEEMAVRACEKVRETGKPFALPPMSPDERRLIHILLQEDADITSTSEGEGSNRHIVVMLRS